MPLEVRRTDEFIGWLNKLRDRKARAIVIRRIDRLAETGSFGDAQPIGSGLIEMRIHYGPGYRIYCVLRRQATIVLWLATNLTSEETSKERRRLQPIFRGRHAC